LLPLGPPVLQNIELIMPAGGAAINGAHAAFGVFAIKLLRHR
jgi:hypothetical protein